MTRALVNVPKTAKRGEIIEIRAMIQHVMETGYREGANGATIPRNIIRRFVCKFADEAIFSAELFPAIAANPFMAFSAVVTESGIFTFEWTDEKGETQSASAEITVT